VLTLVSGTLISRLIALFAIPVLARLYTPAEFGVMALFTTVGSLVACVACGRYEMAIILPEKDRDALHLVVASLVISAVVSVLSLFAFMWSGDWISTVLGSPELSGWLWLAPVMIFASSAYIALRAWAARAGDFDTISRSMIANTLVSVLVQLFLVTPKRLMEGGLIVGRVIGAVVQILVLIAAGWQQMRELYGAGLSVSRMKSLLYRYRDFPLFDAGANLLNETSREMPVLVLGVFFNPVIVGFYSVGRRMLGMPVQLFSNAIAQVFFPKAAEAYAADKLAPLARDVFERLAIAAVTPMLMGIVIMQEGVDVFLGATWSEAAIYVQWLALSVMVIFITAPFAQLFNVLEQQRARLVYVSIMTLLQLAVLGYGGSQGDAVLAVAGFSVVSAVGTMTNYLWLLNKAAVPPRVTVGILAREAALAVPFVLLVWVARHYLDGAITTLAAAAAVLSAFGLVRLKAILGSRAAAT